MSEEVLGQIVEVVQLCMNILNPQQGENKGGGGAYLKKR
jgi:hypothetical protein